MSLDSGAVTTICIFLAANVASSIFFGGAVRQSLRDHDRRITNVEKKADATALEVATIKGREQVA